MPPLTDPTPLSLCLLPQMANPVPSACCVVLAAVVVVYAQRHSQQGESTAPAPSARLGPGWGLCMWFICCNPSRVHTAVFHHPIPYRALTIGPSSDGEQNGPCITNPRVTSLPSSLLYFPLLQPVPWGTTGARGQKPLQQRGWVRHAWDCALLHMTPFIVPVHQEGAHLSPQRVPVLLLQLAVCARGGRRYLYGHPLNQAV